MCVAVVISITGAAAAGDCDPPMFPAALYDAGGTAEPVPSDIDSDGDVDLVFAGGAPTPESGPGSRLVPGASILLNNGCGLLDWVLVPVGRKQYSVAVADMNHDRRSDIVFTTYPATGGSWPMEMWTEVLLSNGDGSFTTAAEVSVPSQSKEPVIADFNMDGHPDVMIVAPVTELTWAGALMFMAGGGDGTLAAPMAAIDGAGYNEVRLADFDEDGLPDIACEYFDGEDFFIRVLRGTGTGALTILTEIPIGNYGLSKLHLEDLDHDGHVDVVAVSGYSVTAYFGDGRGNLAPLVLHVSAGEMFYVGSDLGDVDRDGDVDLVTTAHIDTGPGGNSLFVRTFRNLGGGRFDAPQDAPWPLDPDDFDLVDLNADGAPDMVTTPLILTSPIRQLVILGRGDGSFDWPEERIPGFTPTAVAPGDVTGDGLTDMVCLTPMRVFPGIGEGEFGPPTQYGMTGLCNAATLADLEDDGDLDVVAISDVWPDGAQVAMQEEGAFWASSPFPTDPPRDFAIGDFDGNGIGDIVTVSWEQDSISVLLSLFPLFYWPAVEFPHAMIGKPQAVATGDINGDSVVDFVVKHTYGGQGPGISVYLGRGDGTFAEPQEYFADSGGTWGDLFLADLDHDGDLDACYGGGLVVHLNDGRGDFSAQVRSDYSSFFGLAGVEDFNGDGVLDAALAKSQTLALLLGNGDGSFHQLGEFYIPSALIQTTDFDNDNDVDLIAVSPPTPGSPGSPVRFLTNRSPPKLVGDVDGDRVVNGTDLELLLGAWGACLAKAPCPADLDGTGIVNGFDLAMLLAAWS